jgi:hypothetical protein
MKKRIRKNVPDEADRDHTARLIRNLAVHGMTGHEMKRILREIRVRWWEKGDESQRKESRR